MAKKVRIRQVRSGNGAPDRQRRTLRALGLRHHQDEVVKEDGPSIRGMLRMVAHMVEVEEIDGNNG